MIQTIANAKLALERAKKTSEASKAEVTRLEAALNMFLSASAESRFRGVQLGEPIPSENRGDDEMVGGRKISGTYDQIAFEADLEILEISASHGQGARTVRDVVNLTAPDGRLLPAQIAADIEEALYHLESAWRW